MNKIGYLNRHWISEVRAPLMGKRLLRGGSHHKRERSVAKNTKLSTKTYTVLRTPPKLFLFQFYTVND